MLNKKTKLKSIIIPEPTVNQRKVVKKTGMEGDSDAAMDGNTVVALYASIDGVVKKSDVDSLIKRKKIELLKGAAASS